MQEPHVTAGIRCDGRNNDSTACAQPREKEIYDFVFERGKGTAHFCVFEICIQTNNVVYIKYLP